MLAARTWIFWLAGVLIICIWTCFGHFNQNQSKGISCLYNYLLIRLFVHPTFFRFLASYIFSYHVDRDRKEKIKEQSLCNEAFRIIKGLHSKSNTFFHCPVCLNFRITRIMEVKQNKMAQNINLFLISNMAE